MEAMKQFLYKAGICETPLLWAVEDARKVFIGYLQTVTLKEKENEDGKIRTDSKWRFL